MLRDLRGVFLAPRSIARSLRFVVPVAALLCFFSIAQRPATIAMPRLVLWAWERPEDLRFIDSATTGVAYLAATVDLQSDGTARFHVRQQPLLVPQDASLTAVVRIESPSRYVFPDAARFAAGIANISHGQDVKALQIDFDARASERSFYRAFLVELRRGTPLPIGITALASWCDRDSWINSQPLAEAVPMFFRMGGRESRNMSVNAPGCSHSIGLSTDEAWPSSRPRGLRDGARIYVFNPHAWTKPDYDHVVRHVKEWR